MEWLVNNGILTTLGMAVQKLLDYPPTRHWLMHRVSRHTNHILKSGNLVGQQTGVNRAPGKKQGNGNPT